VIPLRFRLRSTVRRRLAVGILVCCCLLRPVLAAYGQTDPLPAEPKSRDSGVQQASIHDAARDGDLAQVRALLKHNPDLVSTRDSTGRTPLHFAAYEGHEDVVELLLAHGADVNAKADNGETPLHFAARKGYTNVVKLLWLHGADVDAKDNHGDTPLDLAAVYGNSAVAEVLRHPSTKAVGKTTAPTGTAVVKTTAPTKAVTSSGIAAFKDNGDGTVTDKKAKLMWQKNDDGRQRSWDGALNYCRTLSLGGHSDWRLPSLDELISLWKNAGSRAEIRETYFPSMKSSGELYPGCCVAPYWSSGTGGPPDSADFVNFDDGSAHFGTKNGLFGFYSRCVRLGK